MAGIEKIARYKGGISLRIKVFLLLFFILSLLTLLTTFAVYKVLHNKLFKELQNRVKDIAELGVKSIDISVLNRLIRLSSPNLSIEKVRKIEMSEDFKKISEAINWIRDRNPEIIYSVYIFAPADNEKTARYIVDADTLKDIESHSKDENISHFNQEFDISNYPVMKKAIKEEKVSVEDKYYFDYEGKVNSISAYAPIFDEKTGKLVALLGIDVTDKNVSEVLKSTVNLILSIGIASLLISVILSIFIGSSFTRGIRYLDRVVSRFGERDFSVRANLNSKDEVGRLAFSFNIMAETIEEYSKEIEALLRAYDRFVPHDFLDFLSKKSIIDVKLGDSVEREMTILFSDIRSFTSLLESMTPEENFKFINSYLKRVGPEIRNNNGFIDKYIGDAIMALFPQKGDDALNAAISMRYKLIEYNQHRKNSNYRPIDIGIGIHGGKLMLGTVGEEKRMEGTVISDAVNLASRLEGLTKLYGVGIIISHYSFEKIGNKEKYLYRFLDKVRVKGKTKPVKIYEIYNADNDEQKKLKREQALEFSKCLEYYYAKDFKTAKNIFTNLQKENPYDKVFKEYIFRCERNMKYGVDENWDGVEILEVK